MLLKGSGNTPSAVPPAEPTRLLEPGAAFGSQREGSKSVPQKASLRSRHECSGDSGTTEQKNREIRLKYETFAYLMVLLDSRMVPEQNRAGSAGSEPFLESVFCP